MVIGGLTALGIPLILFEDNVSTNKIIIYAIMGSVSAVALIIWKLKSADMPPKPAINTSENDTNSPFDESSQ